jgi:hypothetical protein
MTASPPCRRRSISSAVLLLALAAAGGAARSGKAATEAGAARRPFTVQDAIEMSSIVAAQTDRPLPRAAPLFSPDGRSFLLISQRGKLASDQTEATIWLFDRQAVTDYVLRRTSARPAPRPVATVAATSNMEVVSAVRWLPDSAAISFLGKNGSPYQRLFTADVRTGQRTALSAGDAFVSAYRIQGETAVYATVIVPPRAAAPGDEIVAVTGKSLFSLFYPEPLRLEDLEDNSIAGYALALHVRRRGAELPLDFRLRGKPLRLGTAGWTAAPPLAISPDGNFLITLAPVPEIPAGWDAYAPQPSWGTHRPEPGDPRAVAEDNYERPFQFVLVDLRTGLTTPLVDAPAGITLGYEAPTSAIWTADSRQAILCNTFLPLAGTSGAQRAQRAAGPSIVVVDTATRSLRAVKPLAVPTLRDPQRFYVDGVSWDAAREEMTLTYVVPPSSTAVPTPPPETFALRGDAWIRRPATATGPGAGTGGGGPAGAPRAASAAVELAVEEAFDRPPALVGRPRGETASTVVWDPNPQLAGLALGKVSFYRWQAKDGTPWAGILALPPDYEPGRRYPLVIQTHGYRVDKFFVEGSFTTGSGGRALAARGVVVLQMDMPATHLQTALDAPQNLAGFQGAVARLSADGWIDPRRVGVVGFSYTCYYTLYALTNDPDLFAAASITDGWNQGYWQYLIDDRSTVDLFEQVNGGRPWGAGQANWLARSPGLNLDKVKAPLLVSALEQGTLLSEWEPYAGLHLLGKPVDMLWLRRGNATHVVFRPWHQQISEQSAVDWFDFWLNGREDPTAADPADLANRANPARLEQYARWRELRKLLPAGAPAAPAGRR